MMTALETAEAIRDKRISSREAVSACITEIERCDPALKAFVHLEADRALQSADRIDRKITVGDDLGAMAGVPIAIKDNICTEGSPTACGSKMLAGYVSPYAAHVAERLEAVGAVIVGKTNLDEFAMGSSTENSALFTTHNPWDPSRVAGGSSGGSCAAVAARMVPCALGSDTGGSIRQPASFNGVLGLKPTYGRVSRYGLVAFGSSLDQIGPITRDARDAALIMSVIAGYDPRDATSVDQPVPDFFNALEPSSKRARVGIPAEYFGDGLDGETRRVVEAGLARLGDEGAELVEVHLPHLKYAVACYYVIATAEASSNLARFDGVHYGHRTREPADLFDVYARSRQEGLGAEVKRRIMLGTFVLSSGYYDAYYLKASKVRTLIKRDFEEAFAQVDVIAGPATPTTAFKIGEKTGDPLAMYLADVYTVSANLAGIPALSVPCGFDCVGLPVGLQLMGPWFGEKRLLSLAHRYQLLTDHHARAPGE